MEVTVTQIRSRLRGRDKEIGKQIRLARKLKSWSLTRLAEQIGVSYQQLQKYEKGENRVSASMLLETSQVLTLPLSFFYAEPENAHERHPTFEELQTAFRIHAIEDPVRKSLFLKLVKQLSF